MATWPPCSTCSAECENDKVFASDGQAGAQLSEAVGIHGDVAVVGAALHDCEAGDDCGQAYVFRRTDGMWIEEAILRAPTPEAEDHFGASVAVYGDVIVVGSPQDDDAATNAGAVCVFEFDGQGWTYRQTLTAADAFSHDWLGDSVSIDGDVIVAGADLSNAGGNNAGSAYVFRFADDTWTEEKKLVASDAGDLHQFGSSVAVRGDEIIVGAKADDHAGARAGSAYVFRFDGNDWIEEKKLTASDPAGDDWFGWSVAIEDGVAVVGSRYDDDNGGNSGSVYVYRFDGADWGDEQKLNPTDGAAVDRFGEAVSLDNGLLVVGAPGDDDGGSGAGSAYVLRDEGDHWVELRRLNASDAVPDDRLGISAAISGSTVISGAFRDDDAGNLSGSAYFFAVPKFPTVLDNFAGFQDCFHGAGVAVSPCCDRFDAEPDNDVDLEDYRSLRSDPLGP
jgi:hypothetical protein